MVERPRGERLVRDEILDGLEELIEKWRARAEHLEEKEDLPVAASNLRQCIGQLEGWLREKRGGDSVN